MLDVISLDWSEFEYATKVDPVKRRPESIDVFRYADAVIVGGSDGVTEENLFAVFERLRVELPDFPLVQEPYHSAHVLKRTVGAADAVLVPAAHNGDETNFVKKHAGFFAELARKSEDVIGSGLPFVGSVLAPKGRELVDGVIGEGYVVQNPGLKVAGLMNVEEHYTPEQVAGAALATESPCGLPIFYTEYSGRYVGPEDVLAAAPFLDETALLYDGGTRSRAQTDEILDAGADAVMVGDCPHEDTERSLGTVPTT